MVIIFRETGTDCISTIFFLNSNGRVAVYSRCLIGIEGAACNIILGCYIEIQLGIRPIIIIIIIGPSLSITKIYSITQDFCQCSAIIERACIRSVIIYIAVSTNVGIAAICSPLINMRCKDNRVNIGCSVVIFFRRICRKPCNGNAFRSIRINSNTKIVCRNAACNLYRLCRGIAFITHNLDRAVCKKTCNICFRRSCIICVIIILPDQLCLEKNLHRIGDRRIHLDKRITVVCSIIDIAVRDSCLLDRVADGIVLLAIAGILCVACRQILQGEGPGGYAGICIRIKIRKICKSVSGKGIFRQFLISRLIFAILRCDGIHKNIVVANFRPGWS